MILAAIDEAQAAGARLARCCEVSGLDVRTVQRWRGQGPDGGADRRCGPRTEPGNKLSAAERRRVVEIANRPEFRNLSPKQIVPQLADRGVYVASESTFYRVLREEGQLAHRERTRPASVTKPRELVATAPNQVWSWDITYLRTDVRGRFFFLYLVEDIWSRKLVGWAVHDEESNELAADLIAATCMELHVDPEGLFLHSDNGGPMKGSMMLATLQRLGIVASFSRPRVSDDNPYSEATFRTLKYHPSYPSKPFASLDEARAWVASFVDWYNTTHLHSAVRFVTPADRHAGRDATILARRVSVYEAARRRRPERWSRHTRNWKPIDVVRLNPARDERVHVAKHADARDAA